MRQTANPQPVPEGLMALLSMGGAGTIPSPGNVMLDTIGMQSDPFSDPGLMGAAGAAGGMGILGGTGIGPVSGPLRTVNGVTMVAPAIRSLLQMRKQLGVPVFGQVVSDYRTRAQQAALYQKYLSGSGNLAARPGTSNHETGHAVDISSAWLAKNPQVRRWLISKGWTNDVPGEPWHWEYGA